MGITNDVFVDGTDPKCSAEYLNSVISEVKNLIEDSGQTYSVIDREQQSKAASIFAADGNFYIDSGTANAYVLNPISGQKGVSTLVPGMKFRFKALNSNTTASTVNINSIGILSIKDSVGNDLASGVIGIGNYYDLIYDVAGYFKLIITQNQIPLADSITAGNGQNSVFLTSIYNIITTCATSGYGVTLPTTFALNSEPVTVTNMGAKIANLYPASGDNFVGLGANVPIKILPNNSVTVIPSTANTSWKLIQGFIQEKSLSLSITTSNWSFTKTTATLLYDILANATSATDGIYLRDLCIQGTFGGSASNAYVLTLANLVFLNAGAIFPLSAELNSSGSTVAKQYAYADGNASTIEIASTGAAFNRAYISGGCQLESQTLI